MKKFKTLLHNFIYETKLFSPFVKFVGLFLIAIYSVLFTLAYFLFDDKTTFASLVFFCGGLGLSILLFYEVYSINLKKELYEKIYCIKNNKEFYSAKILKIKSQKKNNDGDFVEEKRFKILYKGNVIINSADLFMQFNNKDRASIIKKIEALANGIIAIEQKEKAIQKIDLGEELKELKERQKRRIDKEKLLEQQNENLFLQELIEKGVSI